MSYSTSKNRKAEGCDTLNEFCEELEKRSAGGCELKVWPGAYHELFNEMEREKILEYAMEFVEEHI